MGAKIFYFLMNLIIFIILLLYKNPLLDALKNFNFTYLIIYILLVSVASYLLLIAGKNPGFGDKK